MEETELLAIKRSDLDRVLENYPDITKELRTIANQRYDKNKEAIKLSQKAGFKIEENKLIFINV